MRDLAKKNIILVDIWEEFLSENEKIKELVSLELRERGDLVK